MKKLLTTLLCLALLAQVMFPVWAEDEVEAGPDQEILIQDDQETDSEELTVEIDNDDGFISEELDDVSLSADTELIELDGELLFNEESVETAETDERSNAGLLQSNGTYTINGKSIYPTMIADPGDGQCWAYANGIYYNIWGVQFDSTFVGSSGTGYNMLRNLGDGDRTLTAEHLKNFIGQAALGATIRIGGCTSSCSNFNNDGLSCKHSGHSLILVAKSDSGFTTFERLTGPGRREKTWTWDSFCSAYSGYPYIKYIKWPGAESYDGHSSSTPDRFIYDINECVGDGSVIYLHGWVFNDVNKTKSIQIHVYLDGGVGSSTICWSIPADKPREDVDSFYHVGEFHGFDYTITNVSQGNHTLYLYANDQYRNSSTFIGTFPVTVTQDTFVYDVNHCIGSEESVSLRGWLFNQNNVTRSIQIHVYLDGNIGSHTQCWSFDANTSRKDVDEFYHVGEFHGFDITIENMTPGQHTLYLYANDQYRNSNTYIGSYPAIIEKKSSTPAPTVISTVKPTVKPTNAPTVVPTAAPTAVPTAAPTVAPTVAPTAAPTVAPTVAPTAKPTTAPTTKPTVVPTVKPPVVPTSVTLNKAKATVVAGAKLTLKAKVEPADAETTLSWTSSNKKIVTVTQEGVVKALKKGSATITVTTRNGLTAFCKITVPTAPTKVTLNKKEATLKVGKKLTLKAKLTPAKAKTTLTWSSSNKKVATVNSKGVVKAVKPGKAKITVKTANGKKATVTITVTKKRQLTVVGAK